MSVQKQKNVFRNLGTALAVSRAGVSILYHAIGTVSGFFCCCSPKSHVVGIPQNWINTEMIKYFSASSRGVTS